MLEKAMGIFHLSMTPGEAENGPSIPPWGPILAIGLLLFPFHSLKLSGIFT